MESPALNGEKTYNIAVGNPSYKVQLREVDVNLRITYKGNEAQKYSDG